MTWRQCDGEPNAMPGQRFKVGIVGLKPGRGWAVRAHIPALRALSETFEIVGVANASRVSAEEAAAAIGLPRAFADVAELIAAPEVDIVTITGDVNASLKFVENQRFKIDGWRGLSVRPANSFRRRSVGG